MFIYPGGSLAQEL